MKRMNFPLKLDMMLDSGAFSAYTKGEKVNLDDYMAYIKKYEKYLTCYVNLDVIGDAEATARNQEIMEANGLKPMPVFHIGEEFVHLKRLMDKYEYIGIGGIANLSGTSESFIFLNKVFDMVCDSSGIPQNKLHAFGITNTHAMMNYPWYSVDSTSWLYSSRMGLLYLPRRLPNGDWDFLETTGKYFKPSITPLSPVRGKNMAHIDTYPPAVQELYRDWLDFNGWKHGRSQFISVDKTYALRPGERKVSARQSRQLGKGKDFWVEQILEVGLSNDYTCRDIANATYFLEFQKCLPEYPWKWKRPKLKGFVR